MYYRPLLILKIYAKKSKKSQPRIVALVGDETTQYFVSCESQVLCKVLTLNIAIFTAFACYYCFNLMYPSAAKNFFYFMQDYVLCHPDSTKKSASYLATVSDIKRCM